MLSLGRLGPTSVDYFTAFGAEDYYLAEKNSEGMWWGRGAEALGLLGQVDSATLGKILSGLSPAEKPLVQNALAARRCPGFDLCFSAPKSVSILWAASNFAVQKVIVRAHDEATRTVLRFLETEAAFSRRGKGGATLEAAQGISAALFRHFTSRDHDMQLHTHALVMNVAERGDQTWGSLDWRLILRSKMDLGRRYRLELARGLKERLGIEPVFGDLNLFEVAGVPRELIEHFSKRSREIREHSKRFGLETAKAKAVAALSTRKTKVALSSQDLLSRWNDEIRSLGFEPAVLLRRARDVARTAPRKAQAALLQSKPLVNPLSYLVTTLFAGLSSDERQALRELVSSKEQVSVVSSAEKKTLEAACKIWERSAGRVLVAAPTAAAARELERTTGVRSFSSRGLLSLLSPRTVSGNTRYNLSARGLRRAVSLDSGFSGKSFLRNRRFSLLPVLKLDCRSVVVVSDAESVSSKDLDQIVKLARASDSRVILVTDCNTVVRSVSYRKEVQQQHLLL